MLITTDDESRIHVGPHTSDADVSVVFNGCGMTDKSLAHVTYQVNTKYTDRLPFTDINLLDATMRGDKDVNVGSVCFS